MFAKPQSLIVIVALAAIIAGDAPTADAQGIFQRMGSRIRSRVGSPFAPAPMPDADPNPNPSQSNDDLGGSILAPRNGPSELAESSRQGVNEAKRLQKADGRGTIGIRVFDPRPESPEVRVVSFNEHSRADEAGMQRGDAILAIDGVPTPNIAAIAAELSTRKPGEVVQVQVGRRDQTMLLPVQLVSTASPTLERKPPIRSDSDDVSATAQGDASLAMESLKEPMTPSDEERPVLGMEVEEPDGSRGALVVSVTPMSPADTFGIEVGDRIVAVDHRFVVDTNRLAENIETRRDPFAPMHIKLVRDDELIDLVVLLDGSSPPATASEMPQSDDVGGSILSGLGSKLGGLLGGQSPPERSSDTKRSVASNAPREPAAVEPDARADYSDAELPEPTPLIEVEPPAVAPELAAEARDLLDFSDGEPIDQVVFEEAAESANFLAAKESESDGSQPKPPLQAKGTGGEGKKVSSISVGDEVLRELRAEIERLRRRLEMLEKAQKN